MKKNARTAGVNDSTLSTTQEAVKFEPKLSPEDESRYLLVKSKNASVTRSEFVEMRNNALNRERGTHVIISGNVVSGEDASQTYKDITESCK